MEQARRNLLRIGPNRYASQDNFFEPLWFPFAVASSSKNNLREIFLSDGTLIGARGITVGPQLLPRGVVGRR